MTDTSAPQTDVSRPSALPTARLRPQSRLQNSSAGSSTGVVGGAEQSSAEYLDAVEEEWNKRIDAEVETLVEGMVDLVGVAAMGEKDKFQIAQEAFIAECRAESMVRAAHSLLSITHSLKLLLLLSDESQVVVQREEEVKEVKRETQELKRRAAELLDEIVGRGWVRGSEWEGKSNDGEKTEGNGSDEKNGKEGEGGVDVEMLDREET